MLNMMVSSSPTSLNWQVLGNAFEQSQGARKAAMGT